jgi:WD40 repeat protein
MCSGSRDGSIRVWGGASLEHERTLRDEEHAEDCVCSLAAWEGRLISGHASGAIRVWNVATGACDRVLEGHTDAVKCLAVSGTRLVSGSDDSFFKVWAMGAGASWACERTLVSNPFCDVGGQGADRLG